MNSVRIAVASTPLTSTVEFGIEVIDDRGRISGRQRKVQIAPVEEQWYVAGSGRSVFRAGPLVFGITICHKGFRYPETVRAAAQAGATVVFHPHFEGHGRHHRNRGHTRRRHHHRHQPPRSRRVSGGAV